MTLARLFAWQAGLFATGRSGLHAIRVGQLRGEEPMQVVSGPIGHGQVHFVAPPRQGLDSQLEQCPKWIDDPPAAVDGLIRAGIAHLWFATLHPFEDGNGRLARAITDLMLARDGGQSMRLFSLSAQILREREGYYAVLEHSQRGALEVTYWLAWFMEQVESAAVCAQATASDTLAKARFWLRHQATALNERQRKALNRLLDAGPGGFRGECPGERASALEPVNKEERCCH